MSTYSKYTLDDVLNAALELTLRLEGGWANHPADRGKETNFGITIGVFRGLGLEGDLNGDGKVDPSDLKIMSIEHARDIYARLYWIWDKLPQGVELLPPTAVDPRIMIKHFDTAVNCGVKAASLILQAAVNKTIGKFLDVDGVVGPKTVGMVKACDANALLANYSGLQLLRYEGIVARNKSQEVFLRGWTRRAKRIPKWEAP